MVAEYKYKEDDSMARLTNEQLAEIRKRAEAATEGPWLETDGGYVIDSDSEDVIAECESVNNAAFIASARTDIPALLDMIAELQAEVVNCKIMHSKLIEELKKADVYSEKLEREYLSATLTNVMDDLLKKIRRR